MHFACYFQKKPLVFSYTKLTAWPSYRGLWVFTVSFCIYVKYCYLKGLSVTKYTLYNFQDVLLKINYMNNACWCSKYSLFVRISSCLKADAAVALLSVSLLSVGYCLDIHVNKTIFLLLHGRQSYGLHLFVCCSWLCIWLLLCFYCLGQS